MDAFFNFLGSAAFPAALVYIVLLFRPQIRDALSTVPHLAGRVSRIGPLELQQGGAVAAAAIEARAETGALATPVAALPPMRDLEPFEVNVRETVSRSPNREADLVQTVAMLVRASLTQHIFGTQLAALRALAASGPLPEAALNGLYQEHVRRATAASSPPLSFLAWVGFLVDRGLAVMDEQGRYVATPTGVALLQFANNAGLSEAKPF